MSGAFLRLRVRAEQILPASSTGPRAQRPDGALKETISRI